MPEHVSDVYCNSEVLYYSKTILWKNLQRAVAMSLQIRLTFACVFYGLKPVAEMENSISVASGDI